jgi:hypothetical protein
MRLSIRNLLRLSSLRVAAAVVTIVTANSSASAQNYDSNHQVRAGVFGQWGIFRGDGVRAGLTDDYAFSSLGIGFAAGIEYVRKETWSYGIELDGAIHSGEDELLNTRYRPNLSGSLRLRAGRHVRPELFWYGTLGVAGMGSEMKATRLGAITKVTSNRVGYVLGTGLERDFGPGLFFAEYLFSDYGSKDTELNGASISTASHVFRIGVKYKVGFDHYADDVVERIGDRLRRRD